MRIAVFGDIHANLPAFKALVAALKLERVEGYYCIGDIVGYGAHPQECIDLVQSLRTVCVAGNHDWAVVGKTPVTSFNTMAKEAVFWTKSHLLAQGVNYLSNLPLTFQSKDFTMVHGMLPHPERFNYLMDIHQAEEMFAAMQGNLCFIGHTHVPKIYVEDAKEASYLDVLEVKVTPPKKYIVNVGSVGQPRDGNPMAAYCLYDTVSKIVSIKRVNYNFAAAQKSILQAGLPEFLATRLAVGQ